MIAIQQLTMAHGARVLFDGVSLHLHTKKRYGIVGANGSGKSTFLQLLAGEIEPLLGEISTSKHDRIGWLKQDQHLFSDASILSVVLRGKPKLWEALEEKNRILTDPNWTDASAHRLARLEETIETENGYVAESEAEMLLTGLGIPLLVHENPLSSLSGGYKLRVLLARALFENPEILLLDEPTNYLDIVTISWLESYLKEDFQGTLLIVSHDHDFLNGVCTHILDIDYGDIRMYTGNYDLYLKQKEQVEEQKKKERVEKQKQADRLQAFVDRFRAKASKASQAQSKLKQLEKLEWPELEVSSRIYPRFSLNVKKASGKIALKVQNLSKSFGERVLFSKLDFIIERGEKIAITGPNGVGKSTLIKIVNGLLPPSEGTYEWGANSQVGYFAQETHDQVRGEQTLLRWLEGAVPGSAEQECRRVLGACLFPKDDAEKKVSALSGGERARLVMAKLMIEGNNILLLDEPTNHLDLEGREALANSLVAYTGTLIFVSHDRHFINRVATKTLDQGCFKIL